MCIFTESVHIHIMKIRLNITIEEAVLEKIKQYTSKKKVSLSQLIEDYLESIVKHPSKRKSIIEMADELHAPALDADKDLKQSYYEEQKSKYGFTR